MKTRNPKPSQILAATLFGATSGHLIQAYLVAATHGTTGNAMYSWTDSTNQEINRRKGETSDGVEVGRTRRITTTTLSHVLASAKPHLLVLAAEMMRTSEEP